MTTQPTLPPRPDLDLPIEGLGFALKDPDIVEGIYEVLKIENAIRWDRYKIACAHMWFDGNNIEPTSTENLTEPLLSALRVTRRKAVGEENQSGDPRLTTAGYFEQHWYGPSGKIGMAVVPGRKTKDELDTLNDKLRTDCLKQRTLADWIDACLRILLPELTNQDTYSLVSTSGAPWWVFDYNDTNRLLTFEQRTY